MEMYIIRKHGLQMVWSIINFHFNSISLEILEMSYIHQVHFLQTLVGTSNNTVLMLYFIENKVLSDNAQLT